MLAKCSICGRVVPSRRTGFLARPDGLGSLSYQTNFAIGPGLLVLMALGMVFLVTAPGLAQPPQPTLGFIFPAGAQRGKTIEATISGTNLQGATGLFVSGKGITTKIVKVNNPNDVRVSITLAADAELGERDVRILTSGGASNRFRFVVGDLPEINEVEPNNEKAKAQRLPMLPVVVNGQIVQSDRDFFRFAAKAGQTLVFEVQGRRLLPYIPDAVPGWLDACLTLYDEKGNELQFADDYRLNPDPVVFYSIPRDGEYLLELRDVLFRGRPEFVYRLKVGVLPYVTHLFPLGGQRNTTIPLEVHGVNLPAPTMNVAVSAESPAVRPLVLTREGLTSNTLPLAVCDYPEVRETEPNDTLAQANRVTVPVTINGRIQKVNDSDYFIFKATQGQTLAMEIQARRLGSPLDSLLTLYNAKGQELAENDDTVDPLDTLGTHHADSRIVYTFSTAGDYVLRIRDVQRKGGEEYAYRLVIGPPRPDFTVRINPGNYRMARGDTALLSVTALRKDGFGAAITFTVQDLPPGFTAPEGVIPAGQDQGQVTISVPRDFTQPFFTPTIVAKAVLGKDTFVRQAEATESVMQAFSINHTVPLKDFLIAVIEPPAFTLSLLPPPREVQQVRQGSQMRVVVKAFRKAGVKGPISLTATALPAGITMPGATIPADKDEVAVTLAVAKQAAVGLRQNIVLNGTLKTEKETITRIVPAIPLQVAAVP